MNEIDLTRWVELLQEMKVESPFRHISYKEKIESSLQELLETDPKQIIKWGWNIWDDTLWGIYWGKIYAIGAESGSWKSTFINQIAMNLSDKNIKVTKYALEDRLQDIWKEELFYISNRILKASWKTLFEWIWFNNNEYFSKNWNKYNEENIKIVQMAQRELEKMKITELQKTKQVWIDSLVKLMKEEAENGTKVFFIDHLHYFKMDWTQRTDLEIQNIMQDINDIARDYNVAVFIVAHYKKLNWQEPDNDSFKDASAIKQVANIIIHIVRMENNITEFRIQKIRWPIKAKTIEASFDIETYNYTNFTYKIEWL